MATIGSRLKRDGKFAQRAAHWRERLDEVERQEAELRLGGGEKRLAEHRAKGKMTARERVAALCDEGSELLELGLWVAHGFYEEHGGAPAAGVVTGLGTIHGRDVVVVANDATVKAGAWFPLTCKKVLRAQEIALENRLPVVYLVDSAGVFLPMQDEIFPDKEHFGRAFYNNARLSAAGVFQMAAIMGPCVAGGAYLPIMSDEAHIVEGTGSIFLAGAHLVKAAIGEEVANEELGGALVQCDVSGVVDHRHPDDASCLAKIRAQFAQLGAPARAPFARRPPREPAHDVEELAGIMPVDRARPYDSREIIARLVDGSELEEYKATYGETLVCGTGWIEGWAVGIVANQRSIVARRTGTGRADKELQIGGVIYSESADKGARFVELCNQKRIPLLFIQDVTGFMVGSRAEHGGIIKDGAKMVNAVANSVVPKITLFTGNSYGAGNYAMCGKAYGARFLYAWPSASIAVMGGDQSANTLLSIQLKNRGEDVGEDEKRELLARIKKRYDDAMDPRYAAARLWVDAIIDPADTRKVVARSLAAAACNPEIAEFKTGVLQT
ncbi:MAG: acyl-CoA carboxylase subunit beta [Acidobacteriota bacterium]|nr:acyl-CoA carboxylase subunit beta [Acidobacteriota bacterium]MDH3524009.1 acyl-CoA carboxylase subunit beta [Acidobacteriota bacterium]